VLRKRKCRNKKCPNDKGFFRPKEGTPDYVKWCSESCKEAIIQKALVKSREDAKRQLRRSQAAEKKRNARQKTAYYQKDTKTRREAAVREFNKFVRLRDTGLPCISCGTVKSVVYCAGHYIAAGNCTALRFDPRNVNRQCNKHCNLELSSNRSGYREGILKRFGQERLDFLEGPQPTIKITVDFYKAIEEKYKAKCKEME